MNYSFLEMFKNGEFYVVLNNDKDWENFIKRFEPYIRWRSEEKLSYILEPCRFLKFYPQSSGLVHSNHVLYSDTVITVDKMIALSKSNIKFTHKNILQILRKVGIESF